jgi:hypothetical protein
MALHDDGLELRPAGDASGKGRRTKLCQRRVGNQ